MPDGVRRQKKAQERRLSKKAPGYDERWIAWEDLLYRVFGRDVVSCPACGARIWLVDQVTDPVSAQRELLEMGRVTNVIVFAPSRGSPADFFAP